MKTYNIGVLGGMESVLSYGGGFESLAHRNEGRRFDCNFIEYPYSGTYYLKTKELVPDRVIDEWRTWTRFSRRDATRCETDWSNARSFSVCASGWTCTLTCARSNSTLSALSAKR